MQNDSLNIVITGIGVLAPNGIGRAEFWDALENGRSGIRLLDRFDPLDLPCRIAGQVWDFDPHQYLSKANVKRWHRVVHQSVAATKLAMEDAQFDDAGYDLERVAVAIGSSVSDRDEEYDQIRVAIAEHGWSGIEQFSSSTNSAHASTANVCAQYKFRGPAITIGSGCATGLDTIAWGTNQIRNGHADVAIVGASENPVTYPVMCCAQAIGILSQNNDEPDKAMRPFDHDGDGLVLSEAAVVLVLERASTARKRNAPIFAEIAGGGAASEGGNALLLERSGEAVSRAVLGAVRNAGMNPQDVDCIQAHGAGLSTYDKAEVQAYRTAFGAHATRIPISAVKSMTGQPYSVGGLLGVAGGCMSLTTGIIPPTINFTSPAEGCDLDFVPNEARLNAPSNVLVTAMSFGGTHSSLMLRKVA
ncbi:MAG: beta-ketoacyl-[acyl-carrier-protein] synthase family protein [Candidatus Hydrogenedentota bacterium]